jgi:hypothetical protein
MASHADRMEGSVRHRTIVAVALIANVVSAVAAAAERVAAAVLGE